MYFIGSDKQGTRILNDEIDDVRMYSQGGTFTSMSRGYKTLKVMKADRGVLGEPCVECGCVVETSYREPVRSELIKGNICHNCHFWMEKVQWEIDKNPNVVRVDGWHNLITPDDPSAPFQGYGGREFVIKFNDGREVISHNLWHQGTIPDHFRDRLPDNAIFKT